MGEDKAQGCDRLQLTYTDNEKGDAMWIFGYGSLMTDGWEVRYGCTLRDVAELHGYRRVFNKASIVNWGTRGSPCPTLNLEPFAGALCIGIAFEFPKARRAEVEAYLAKREGKGFMLAPLEVIVKGVGSAHALVPLYTGKNILTPETMQGLVATVQPPGLRHKRRMLGLRDRRPQPTGKAWY